MRSRSPRPRSRYSRPGSATCSTNCFQPATEPFALEITMTMPVRAALYLRVSTGRQADNDLSIPDQRRQAKAYCASRGWEIAVGLAGCPGTRVGRAAARQHARDHSLRRAIATSRANANSIVGRDFRPNHTDRRAIAGPRALNGLCDDEGVPLICPTCQVLAQSFLTGDRRLLCMGLFSIFWLEAKATRRGCENPA